MNRPIAAAIFCALAVAIGLWFALPDGQVSGGVDAIGRGGPPADQPDVEPDGGTSPPEPSAAARAKDDPASARGRARWLLRLIREASRTALSGARVRVDYVAGSARGRAAGTTNPGGDAVFDLPAPCRLIAFVVEPTADTVRWVHGVSIPLAAGDDKGITYAIASGGALLGTVVDRAGRPIPNARVSVWMLEPSALHRGVAREPDRATIADGRGRFQVEHVGGEFTVGAVTETHAPWRFAAGKTGKRARIEDLTVVVAPAVVLRGTVVREGDRAPVPGARVWSYCRGGMAGAGAAGVQHFGPRGVRTEAGPSGRFEVRAVAGERLTLHAAHEGYDGSQVDAVAPESVAIVLRRSRELTGVVRLPAGAPATAARVSIQPSERLPMACDAAGRFRFASTALERESWLEVELAGHATAFVHPIPRDGRVIEVQLERARSITGIVVDGAGQPVPNLLVTAHGSRKRPVDPRLRGLTTVGDGEDETDRSGAFRIDGLYAGRFELRVHLGGRAKVYVEFEANSGDRGARLVVR